MFDNGLVDEVQSLLDSPKGLGRQAGQALGYREVIHYLQGNCTLDEAKVMLKLHTRRFSKRQMTWFRSFSNIKWLEVKEGDSLESISEKIISVFKGKV